MDFFIFTFLSLSLISTYPGICMLPSGSLDLCGFINILEGKHSLLKLQTLLIIARYLIFVLLLGDIELPDKVFPLKKNMPCTPL